MVATDDKDNFYLPCIRDSSDVIECDRMSNATNLLNFKDIR